MSQANTVARNTAPTNSGFRRANRLKLLRPVLMIGGVVIVVVGSLIYWLTGGRYVGSDDTYVDAAKVSLSTDVSGLVGEVDVKDNQHVEAGQVLFKLGQKSFDIAVAQAQAQLDQAKLDVASAKRAYAEALDEIAAQKVQIADDQSNLAKYAAVVGNGGVTKAIYDDARFKLQADQIKLTQLQDESGIQLAKLANDPAIPVTDTPEYQTALAQLNNAKLQQEHSVVVAPFSGTVTMVEQLQPGMFLPAGTAAFGLVSDTDFWVTAQPKESDLTWVKPGQSVDITVDAYPGQTWHGMVQSISPASGSEFSILPAQNSSGNWVKVVQRIPVRVQITSGPRGFILRDGMSAEINIDTQHHRHLSDLF
ncbi:MAG: secretion protein HlyD [Acidocella sp. 20-57-95]|nr:MAG: secretion protein HlyD [Acidocella sp. 20-57-95]OYV58983.1 MAG: secretion protein HlyD [Acidocella sp. 21-58-7]HQT63277.1 HlyD family secretion protein [Acidocella sp.]HQU03760.1 HlyD family secretion protein [Acidocella sp.]